MRLTNEEKKDLIKAIEEFIGKNPAELRLFGSRTDEHLKGGDIDLLLLVSHSKIKNQLQAKKHLILARIKELLGDQKIDLYIAQFSDLDQDPFLQVIYPKSLVLNIWMNVT